MLSSSLLKELSLLHCLYPSQVNLCTVLCCTSCVLEVGKGALNMGLLLCIYAISVVLDEFTRELGTDLQHKLNHTFSQAILQKNNVVVNGGFRSSILRVFYIQQIRASSRIFLLLPKKAFFPETQCSHQQSQIRLSDLEGLNLYGECVALTIIARH